MISKKQQKAAVRMIAQAYNNGDDTGIILARLTQQGLKIDKLIPEDRVIDDFSPNPENWSMKKLVAEKANGMPAVVAAWEKRVSE